MTTTARAASVRLSARSVSHNPMIPDNFLDVSAAGFPADLIVQGVQIPRQGSPAEMSQYRNMIELQWLHVPWSAISTNGGNDGKAHVPGATKVDLGGGQFVASLAGHYLMYADRKQYEQRRARNIERASQSLQYKTEFEEEVDGGVRKGHMSESGTMSLDELLEYEKKLGPEAPRMGD